MLSGVYRMWSKTRLRHLQPWVEAWTLPEMLAGVEGKGAEDAAYATALLVEWCNLTKTEFSGGPADIYKCFDQIVRPLLQKVLEFAGMPREVLRAYMAFLENLWIRNTIAGGLGEEYAKEASIPQGDPMSMAVVALLMRAWIVQMRQLAVSPRLLADDLQLVSTGARHLDHFQYAYSKTHLHLEEMGARIAPGKRNTFSSNNAARNWLRKHKWRRLGTKVEVISDCRDLGAHFNATG